MASHQATLRRLVVGLVAALVASLLAAAPAAAQTGVFDDVVDDAYYSVPVAALAEDGVFVGTECGDGGFCPSESLDRQTMAVWTVRVLDGADPAAVSATRFADVEPDSFYAPFVERMADLGITQGCGDGTNFCPERPVTRAQMAVFLSRAYSLPDGPDPRFADVASDAWFAADVARLAASGITVGCGDGTGFCPSRATTRAQMAVFLWRAEQRSDDRPGVEVPSPDDREVLAHQSVGAGGAVVSHGMVRVSVPAGALDGQAEVAIRAPLGEFGGEVGGEVVSVEHSGPVLAPITVVWDVSHLSDLQQQALILVRWDDELADWVPPDVDPDHEIVGGVLTARIGEWSNWVWNTVANLSQTAQEILGRRVDAPKCAEGDLDSWVDSASETGTGFHADAIRLCFEKGPYEAVRVRMANNRTFGQFVHFEGGDGFGKPVLSSVDLTPSGLARQAAFRGLTSQEEGRAYIPPLKTVVVDVVRPAGGGSHQIRFRNEQTMGTFIIDVVIFVLDAVEAPNLDNTYFDALAEVLFECGVNEVAALAQSGDLRKQLQAAVNAVHNCTSELVKPESTLGTKLLDKMSKQVGGIDEAVSKIEKGAKALKKALRLLKIVEFVGILSDLILQAFTGTLFFFIRGQGRNLPLGQWTPTCSDIPTDSNRLVRNLVFQNIFADKSTAFHEFDAWEPSVAIAVTPLKACDPDYRIALADHTPNDWGDDPAAGNVVRDSILDLDPDQDGDQIPDQCESDRDNDGVLDTYARDRDNDGILDYGDCDDTIDFSVVADSTFSAVSAGQAPGQPHSCALRTDGTIQCWGYNTDGQADGPDGQFSAVSAGGAHTCAVQNLSIDCWGNNDHGQTQQPVGAFRAVSAGPDHSCGLLVGGSIKCWGNNSHGQIDVPSGRFSDVSAGENVSCAVRTDGTITCWGGAADWSGLSAEAFTTVAAGGSNSCALGTDQTITCRLNGGRPLFPGTQPEQPTGTFSALSVNVSHGCGLTTANTITCWGWNAHRRTEAPQGTHISVSAGYEHSCAVRTDGTITCWGRFAEEQQTDTSQSDGGLSSTPQFNPVSAGDEHSCGLRTDGTVTCWGNNRFGAADAPTGTFSAVSAGRHHSCGLRTNGTIQCWGNNSHGEIDVPSGRFSAVSVGIDISCGLRTDGTVTCWGRAADAPTGTFSAVAAVGGHSCGLLTNGTITCWGYKENWHSDVPPGRFTAVSGYCGVRIDGTVTCWGYNHHGQTDAPTGTFSAVSAGGGHSCGLRTSGTVECWGRNNQGQADAPAGQFTAVSAGFWISCGLRTDEKFECWGYGLGASGAPAGEFTTVSARGRLCGSRVDGTITCFEYRHRYFGEGDGPSSTYSSVSAGDALCALRSDAGIECWSLDYPDLADAPAGQYTALSTGTAHSCGLLTNGTITCWGYKENWHSDVPPGRFTAVSAGLSHHSCGLRTDGTVACWGFSSFGQTTAPQGTFISVSAGRYFTCGVRSSGTVECWGRSEHGLTDAPSGEFAAVSAGYNDVCGLRTDGTIACWGLIGEWPHDVPSGQFKAVSGSCGLTTNGDIVCWGSRRLFIPGR